MKAKEAAGGWSGVPAAIGVPDGMKLCSKCGEVKAVGEFGLDRSKKDGLKCKCKKCCKENYKENAEKIKERNRKYRQTHPEYKTIKKMYYIRNKTGAQIYRKYLDDATFFAIHSAYMLEKEIKKAERESVTDEMRKERRREYCRENYLANLEKFRNKKRKYRLANIEKVREQDRESRVRRCAHIKEKNTKYYAENKEKERERAKQYRIKNREKINEKAHQYRAKNQEKMCEYKREYRAKNQEKIREKDREYTRRYRARKKAEKALLALDNSAAQADNVDM